MKIFDSSPEITLERPRRRRTIMAITAIAAVLISLVVAYFYQRSTYLAQVKQLQGELITAQGNVKSLQAEMAGLKEKLDASSTSINSCTSSLASETSKVAAFAKQAAACEVIRTKLNLKG